MTTENGAKPPLAARSSSLRNSGLAAFAGVVLLASLWYYNQQLDVRPVYLRLPTTAGSTSEATFIPTHTDVYELEVELREPADADVFDKYIKTPDNGAFDGTWTASSAGEQLAGGNFASYLYLSMPGPYRRRVLQVVGLDSYRDVSAARMSRGVGRFRAVAGEAVNITLQIGSAIPKDVAIGDPHLVVRVNRRLGSQYLNRSLAGLIAACSLIGLSLLWYLWQRARKSG